MWRKDYWEHPETVVKTKTILESQKYEPKPHTVKKNWAYMIFSTYLIWN